MCEHPWSPVWILRTENSVTMSARRCTYPMTTFVSSLGRGSLSCAVLAAVALDAVGAPTRFDIPGQHLEQALLVFAEQAGTQVLVQSGLIDSLSTEGVVGVLEANEALAALLAGSDLEYQFTSPTTVVIRARTSNPDTYPDFQALGEETEATLGQQPLETARASGRERRLGFLLEEVVVTARRVEEKLQDVPMAVSALTGPELALRGAVNLIDVGAAVPSVDIAGSSSLSGLSSAPVIYVRGIGQDDYTVIHEPGVGVYVDGVYVSRMIGSLLDLMDVERVEVLRGPQGTLSGKNSIGGAINLLSKKPAPDFDANIRFTVGDDERQDVEAMLNIPVSEAVYSRLSYMHRDRRGYVRAVEYDDLWLGSDAVDAVRGQLSFVPTDSLRVNVSVDHTRERETPAAQTLIASGGPGPNFAGFLPFSDYEFFNNNVGNLPEYSSNPAVCGSLTHAEIAAGAFPPNDPACAGTFWESQGRENYSVFFAADGASRIEEPENELDISGGSVALTWDVGPGTLKSIISHRETAGMFMLDPDATPFLLTQSITPDLDAEQDSQEIQYSASLLENRLSLTAGIYLFEEEAHQTLVRGMGRSIQFKSLGPPLLGARVDGYHFNDQALDVRNESEAVYAQITSNFTDQWHVTAGARRTEEIKLIDTCLVWPGNGEAQCAQGTKQLTEITPLLSLGYDVSDNMFGYATYSEGFRSGGFPSRINEFVTPLPEYDPEFAETFEIGLKTDLLNNRLRLNVAAFTNEYTDMQLTAAPLGVHLNVIGSATENFGDSTINGLEVELTAALNDNLRLDFAGSWMDAGFDCIVTVDSNFNRTGCSPDAQLIGGGSIYTVDSVLPRTPDFSSTTGVTFAVPLSNGAELLGRVDWRHMGKSAYGAGPPPQEINPSYDYVNARLTYRADTPWEITFGITNLTDEEYFTGLFRSFTSTKGVINRPRQAYASFGYRFGENP